MNKNGSVNWGNVGGNLAKIGVSGAAGAVTGGISVLAKGTSLVTQVGAGYTKAVVGGANSAVNAAIDGKDGAGIAKDAVAGYLGSRIGDATGLFGGALAGNALSDSAKSGLVDTLIQVGKTGLSKVTSKGVSEPAKEAVKNPENGQESH